MKFFGSDFKLLFNPTKFSARKQMSTLHISAYLGLNLAQVINCRLPKAADRLRSHFRSCGICMDKVVLGQVFPEYLVSCIVASCCTRLTFNIK
jgi:hypothetical protein